MISSHTLSELEEMCDRVGIIEQGKMVFSGTLDDVRERMGVHRKVRLRVAGDEEKAVKLLSALPAVESVERLEDAILVTLGDSGAEAGLIARTLVQGGVAVAELVPEKLKLDEAFLQLTEGLVH